MLRPTNVISEEKNIERNARGRQGNTGGGRAVYARVSPTLSALWYVCERAHTRECHSAWRDFLAFPDTGCRGSPPAASST